MAYQQSGALGACVCVRKANVVGISTYLPGGIGHAVLEAFATGTGTSGGEDSSAILIELQVINGRHV